MIMCQKKDLFIFQLLTDYRKQCISKLCFLVPWKEAVNQQSWDGEGTTALSFFFYYTRRLSPIDRQHFGKKQNKHITENVWVLYFRWMQHMGNANLLALGQTSFWTTCCQGDSEETKVSHTYLSLLVVHLSPHRAPSESHGGSEI